MRPGFAIRGASAIAIVGALAIPSVAPAANRSLTVSSESGPIRACDDIKIRFYESGSKRTVPMARGAVQHTFAAPRSGALRVRTSERGGVQVTESDIRELRVSLCKAAAGSSTEDAEQCLERIRVEESRGELVIRGPQDQDWYGFLLVEVPRGMDVDIETGNSEIRVYGASGDVQVRAQNGPITLEGLSGRVRGHAVNGPISYRGSRGDVELEVTNGPVDVWLDGNAWQGSGIEVSAQNGPLSLHVPAEYRSSVRVETSDHSPVSTARGLRQRGRWVHRGGAQVFELGRGEAVVRLSNVNGPVSIDDARDKDSSYD